MQNELIPKKMVDILKVADTENDRCQKWPIPSELADTQNSWFSKYPILKMADILEFSKWLIPRMADTENKRYPLADILDTPNGRFSKCPIRYRRYRLKWPIFSKAQSRRYREFTTYSSFFTGNLNSYKVKKCFNVIKLLSEAFGCLGRTSNEFCKRLTSSLCEWIGRKKILMSEWIISCKWIKVLKLMILTFRWLIIHPMTHLTWVMWPI